MAKQKENAEKLRKISLKESVAYRDNYSQKTSLTNS